MRKCVKIIKCITDIKQKYIYYEKASKKLNLDEIYY